MVEDKIISIGNIAYVLGMSSKKLHRWYQDVLSGFREAEAAGELNVHDLEVVEEGVKKTIRVPILEAKNMGPYLAIDEKTIDGVCYTILSNRDTGKIVAMADTLKSKHLVKILAELPNNYAVTSLTRDMASNYNWVGRQLYSNAYHIVDKFHVIGNVLDYLQDVRVRYRQKELEKVRIAKQEFKEKEAKRKQQCKANREPYTAKRYKPEEVFYANGDTAAQLLARSRGLLFKEREQWTKSQKSRAHILFENYPEIQQAYDLVQEIRKWYRRKNHARCYAKTWEKKRDTLKEWIKKAEKSNIYEIMNLATTINTHLVGIVNFFKRYETNAGAEALNSKIQHFIHVNYGARNTEYFLFRIHKYFT